MLTRERLELWRRRGPLPGTGAAIRFVGRRIRGRARSAYLIRHPLRVSDAELDRALGHADPFDVLRGLVLRAMPTVADWRPDESVLPRAEAIIEHRFDLLGSGPTQLPGSIDWHSDFKTGRRWPAAHISQLPVSYPDHSDIKVPWELCRCQHLPILAAAWAHSREERFLDEIGLQISGFIEENPVEFGPAWLCTMDVAIRAANWLGAIAIVAAAGGRPPWLHDCVRSLLLHGRFIVAHLEDGPVRGNHYLADVVGLLTVSSLFAGSREGRSWASWAVRQIENEMFHQVHADGCAHEGSIPYHRLVTELFICGSQAADALVPGGLSAAFGQRLQRMLRFACDYMRPNGRAPQIGDADDGRFLPLDDYGKRHPQDHAHLFAQAHADRQPPQSAAGYACGGFYFLRAGELHLAIRCGPTGMHGRGAHAHNDQLSFDAALGDRPLVVDPGSYVYTADPAARDEFRSTAFHSTLTVGEAEQNPILRQEMFRLPDRTRAQVTRFGESHFEGRHHGYADLGLLHVRSIELQPDGWIVRDRVEGGRADAPHWCFPLPPVEVTASGDTATIVYGSVALVVVAPGTTLTIEDGWYSPSYGARMRTPFLRATRPLLDSTDAAEFRFGLSTT